jgi:hypothetical protein
MRRKSPMGEGRRAFGGRVAFSVDGAPSRVHALNVPNATETRPALTIACDAAYAISNAALAAWRQRDDIGSAEWRAEKVRVSALCDASKRAQQAVYDAGLEHAPYWWVRPGYNPAARLLAA